VLVFDADAKRVLLHALSLRARVPGLSVAPAWQSAQEQRHHPPARSLMVWSLGRARGGEGMQEDPLRIRVKDEHGLGLGPATHSTPCQYGAPANLPMATISSQN
jgi:hypothetical protein